MSQKNREPLNYVKSWGYKQPFCSNFRSNLELPLGAANYKRWSDIEIMYLSQGEDLYTAIGKQITAACIGRGSSQ